MRIEKFNKLKGDLEIFAFENNFKKLATTLYWFSFLGNIFLILFSYFFIKNVTESIPKLFVGQDIFFSVFVLLFMTGYELFKRFSFEQLALGILRTKKIGFNIFLGITVCLCLIGGSFYLSLNGAHRLIDNSEKIEQVSDNSFQKKSDSIANYYNTQITVTQKQINTLYDNNKDGLLFTREKESLNKFETNIKQFELARDQKIKELEDKSLVKTSKSLSKTGENNIAFMLLVFFLEFIILIGVGFEAYYVWTSYDDMKTLLGTAKFGELEQNLKLLRVLYQDGRRKKEEEIITTEKFTALCGMQNIDVNKQDINNFLQLCYDLGIIQRRKDNSEPFYVLDYQTAKQNLENQIYL